MYQRRASVEYCMTQVTDSRSLGDPRNVPTAVDDCGDSTPHANLRHGDRSLGWSRSRELPVRSRGVVRLFGRRGHGWVHWRATGRGRAQRWRSASGFGRPRQRDGSRCRRRGGRDRCAGSVVPANRVSRVVPNESVRGLATWDPPELLDIATWGGATVNWTIRAVVPCRDGDAECTVVADGIGLAARIGGVGEHLDAGGVRDDLNWPWSRGRGWSPGWGRVESDHAGDGREVDDGAVLAVWCVVGDDCSTAPGGDRSNGPGSSARSEISGSDRWCPLGVQWVVAHVGARFGAVTMRCSLNGGGEPPVACRPVSDVHLSCPFGWATGRRGRCGAMRC